jgi:hypothetical protein
LTRPINPRVHGILDYATVAIFLNAPMVLGFSGTPSAVLYWLAGIHLLMTGLTDFPYGMFKVIPFRVHAALDVLAGVFLLVAPWIFGFAEESGARNFFIALGIFSFVVVALTDYAPSLEIPPREPGDRRRWRGPASTS